MLLLILMGVFTVLSFCYIKKKLTDPFEEYRNLNIPFIEEPRAIFGTLPKNNDNSKPTDPMSNSIALYEVRVNRFLRRWEVRTCMKSRM